MDKPRAYSALGTANAKLRNSIGFQSLMSNCKGEKEGWEGGCACALSPHKRFGDNRPFESTADE